MAQENAKVCPKCGYEYSCTSDIGDFYWSWCRKCGYSPDYPKGKVVGINSNGFPVFENEVDEVGIENIDYYSGDGLLDDDDDDDF